MSNIFETEYKQLLMRCLLKGEIIENRTLVKTYSLFNQNINIDLIYGIPNTDIHNWKQDLQKAVELKPDHISSYCLTPTLLLCAVRM